jgi:oligoendopeptidase F
VNVRDHAKQEHPKEFPTRYVALLKNGFTDTPETLLRSYLNIDLQDINGLIANATNIVRERTTALKRLYQAN